MTKDKNSKASASKHETKKQDKTKDKPKTSNKTTKKSTLKDPFERQKQHPNNSQPDKSMSLPERQKQKSNQCERQKPNDSATSENPTSPLASTSKNKEKVVTPLPSGKLRTPPSLEKEPNYKKALLSTPEKLTMQGAEPTTGKP